MDKNDDKILFSDIASSLDFIKFLIDDNKIIKPIPPDTVMDLNLISTKNVLFPNIYVSISTSNNYDIDILKDAYNNSKLIGVVCQKPNNKDIYSVGTISQILKLVNVSENKIQVVLQGINKFKILKAEFINNIIKAKVSIVHDEETHKNKNKLKAIELAIKELLVKITNTTQNFPEEIRIFLEQNNNLPLLIYLVSSSINVDVDIKQKILEESDLIKKGEILIKYLTQELNFTEIKKRILSKAQDSINKKQKEFFVKQQIEALKEELNGANGIEYDNDIEELRNKSKKKKFSKTTRAFFEKILKKAERLTPNSADYMILISQAEFILELPWGNYNKDNEDIKKAREILNKNHFGMEKVKERILEYLAVYKVKKSVKGSILCLVGPPGVGKTSLCRSIANALNREYVKVSLGGIDDEAEIRGHRKTYVGAMPGRIIDGFHHLKTSNPVFVLDEIDKMTKSQGDPSAALLEVLDPDQNKEFVDHYIETPYDLSKVLFIATANDSSEIPIPLRDRLEIINISGYPIEEKLQIANNHIIPQLLSDNGFKEKEITFDDKTIETIVDNYTMESGVRGLKTELDSILRKITLKKAEGNKYDTKIDVKKIEKYLGVPKFNKEKLQNIDKPGVSIGLCWTPFGGDILFFESSKMKGEGKLTFSGKLGDVMKESANLAFTYIKSNLEKYKIDNDIFKNNDFHIHVPDGATPKDGPSAGITFFSTLFSLITNKKIKNKLAMTGEITLRGNVTAVGGIKEKVLAAKRAGIDTIIMCKDNEKDVSEIKKDYIKGLEFIYVTKIEEIPKLLF